MQQFKSEFLKELQSRGFLNQITHPEELDELLSKQKISAYIGFDCTAKSLHVGSLIQIMILQLLQKHGHKPIVLVGGGTTKIGDPSGKDEARQFLDDTKINENLEGIKKTLSKFDLSKTNPELPAFEFVNNDDWLKNLKYIEFLRDFGRHFSVNKMLTFDSVKLRLERQQPLSFIEFNYMILQAYDFYELNKSHNCVLQIGGSDQWGNIVNGVDLTRRAHVNSHKDNNNYNSDTGEKIPEGSDPYLLSPHYEINPVFSTSNVFGLTTPLLTTSDGKKMGKTADGAVWLDGEMLPAFDYFQYFRNATDEDVERFLKFFTHLTEDEISKIRSEEINKQKEILAFEATKICHGDDAANQAFSQAKSMFSDNVDVNLLPTKEIKFSGDEIQNGKKLIEILRDTSLCESGGEAKRLIKGGGVKVDDQKIDDENYLIKFDSSKPFFKVALGKKKMFKIMIQ